jgi:hypothetical protein
MRIAVNARIMRHAQDVFLRFAIAIVFLAFQPIILMNLLFRTGILIETLLSLCCQLWRKLYKAASRVKL